MRELSIPQIKAGMAACDRRDAALALYSLETVHAAVAPIMVGKEGRTVFEKCAAFLRSIVRPEEAKRSGDSTFGMLLARAKLADAAKKKSERLALK